MTPLWKNDISILYEKKYLLEVIPKEEYDINRKLNSIVRISIYYSLIMYLVKKDINLQYDWVKMQSDLTKQGVLNKSKKFNYLYFCKSDEIYNFFKQKYPGCNIQDSNPVIDIV